MPSDHAAAVADADLERLWPTFVATVHGYAVLLLDPDGCIMSWNRGAELIKGYRAEEVVGRHFSCLYSPEAVEARRPQHELEVAAATGRVEKI
jgi:PAS domain S-box-containing protein